MRLTRDPTRPWNPKSSAYERPNIPSIPRRKHKPLDGRCLLFTVYARFTRAPGPSRPSNTGDFQKKEPDRGERNEPAAEEKSRDLAIRSPAWQNSILFYEAQIPDGEPGGEGERPLRVA